MDPIVFAKIAEQSLAELAWDAGICNLAGRRPGERPYGNGNLALVELGVNAVLDHVGAKTAGDKVRSDGTRWTPAMKRAYYAKKKSKK